MTHQGSRWPVLNAVLRIMMLEAVNKATEVEIESRKVEMQTNF
jgi:hypothetical protein